MTPFVAAGAGFLLAVLWFDLMFDVQSCGPGGAVLPDAVLASIAGYNARVTTGARPMNRLVATVMLATLAAIVVEIARDDAPAWAAWGSLALPVGAVGVAAARTVPTAVRLGTRRDPPAVQSALARAILRQHVVCLGAIGAVLVAQLVAAAE